jgi:membrane-associated phospholipid phosphatase
LRPSPLPDFPPSPEPSESAALPRLWAALPALLLIALAATVALGGRNQEIFITLNEAAAGWLSPTLWSAITLGGSVIGTIALFAPTLKTQARWLASAFLAAPFAILFSEGGKRYFDVMRPAGVLQPESFTLIGQKLYLHSFPSGHATTAFLAAAVAILAWPKAATRGRAATAILGAAALVAFSRIAVGAHWPLDILTGAAGGWVAGVLGTWLSARLRFWQKPGGVRAMAAVSLAVSLALLFLDLGYPLAHIYQIGLAAWGIGGAAAALMNTPEEYA